MEEFEMIDDIRYCASSFLMYRTIADRRRCFSTVIPPRFFTRGESEVVMDSMQLESALRQRVQSACSGSRVALALSGGIDSAILARMLPEGSVTYTFRCVVPGVAVTDESVQASRYAQECGLEHRVVEITWEDMKRYAPLLMRAKGAPIHSIEVQIYKAACRAKADGFDALIFGESADCNYGGLSMLLSRDWTLGEYVDRYANVLPYKVLRDWEMDLTPILPYVGPDGYVDVHEHLRHFFFEESMGSYDNAMTLAGMKLIAPYAETWMGAPLDKARIRSGENKYLIREVFHRLYPGWDVPKKTPMPRPTEQWFEDWSGPTRSEFWPHCTDGMTGDQKWLVWALERFFDTIEDDSGNTKSL